ncbi:MAG: hypothetical protein V6Z81_09820 [Parvularculales bacterium]
MAKPSITSSTDLTSSAISAVKAVGIVILTLFLVFIGQIYPSFAAGFQTITSSELTIGVWYPSDAPEQDRRLGPFDVRLAFDAVPKTDGKYQIILMSHGNSGYFRNYHLTAKALADAGFIVIAPMHAADELMKGDDIPKVLDWRVRELKAAFDSVLDIKTFNRIADISRIHVLGHSLGAVTALNAAGAGFDITLLHEHCARENDPAFCERRDRGPSQRGTITPDLSLDIPLRHFPEAFINGGAAVVAPVGQLVFFEEDSFLARKVFIVGLEGDKITLPQFHAKYLADIFPEKYIEHYSIRPGHHFAFVAPFADRVPGKESIPVAKDPAGFDRKAFLDAINQDLVEFFISQSQTP